MLSPERILRAIVLLIWLALPLMGIEVIARLVFRDIGRHKSATNNAEHAAEVVKLRQALNDSGKLLWTHPLLNSKLTRQNLDDSKAYPAVYQDLKRHLVSHRDRPATETKYASLLATDNGGVVYNVTYTVDNLFRRKTIGSQHSNGRRTLVTLGCSFTFGLGLNDGDTIASQLQSLMPEAKVYNLGIAAGAINVDTRVLNEFPQRYAFTSKTKPLALYFFIENHLTRIACGIECMHRDSNWMKQLPRFTIEGGQLMDRGLFEDNWPWKYDLHWASFIRSFLFLPGVNFATSPRNIYLYGQLMSHFRNKLRKSGYADLIVVNLDDQAYPFSVVEGELGKYGIRTIDLSTANVGHLLGTKNSLPIDGHPSPVRNFAYAWLLRERLREGRANGP